MHIATPDEIQRAVEIASAMDARFHRLMDARVGAGKWADPTSETSPAPEESALISAESDVLGWLYLAKEGKHLRESLDRSLLRLRKRLESWKLPVPHEISTGGRNGI